MAKNILILEGSPRSRGNSTVLAEHAAKAAREAGAQVETIFLHYYKINTCTACEGCIRTGKFCVIHDDMQELYPKLLAADGLIVASPIYWFTYSAQLKTAFDRMYGLWNNHPDFLRGKPVGGILIYGDENEQASGVSNAVGALKDAFTFLKAEMQGFVTGSLNDVGEAERSPEMLQKAADLGRKVAGF